MEGILKVVSMAMVGLVGYLVLKKWRDDIAILFSLSIGVVILLFVMPQVAEVLNLIKRLAEKGSIEPFYIATTFKIIAIAYITTIASEICKDAGVGSLGSKVELAGKVMILMLAVPIIYGLLDTIVKLL
ncbi:stage III sporulation protein AD [Clostridium bornimense]|uniref:stage III sporulation protein AD n=1 Tax=Clostridium bornimense TaxID=1216932 RepID=UPI001C116BB6|nr:stage III sporulation protein AD [Clostridium bornimense]MBU5315821.1 stage III sporulation protein AD [Clostridium bornimense]